MDPEQNRLEDTDNYDAILESTTPLQPVQSASSTAATPTLTAVEARPKRPSLFKFNKGAFLITAAAVAAILLIGVLGMVLFGNNDSGVKKSATGRNINFATSQLSVEGVEKSKELQIGKADKLSVNGQLIVKDTFVLSPTSTPTAPVTGQIYFDQASNTPFYFNGTQFISMAPAATPQTVTSLGGISGAVSIGNGLQVANGQLALTPEAAQALTGDKVNSIQGQTGNVSFTSGSGIGINGTTITNTGITGITGANGLSVGVASGQATLSLPQLLGVADSPTFGGLTLTAPLGVASGGTGAASFTNGGAVYYNGTQLASTAAPVSNGLCLLSASGGPQFGSCSGSSSVTSLDGLTGALSLQAGTGINITNNSADVITITSTVTPGANTSLSNLSGVAINTTLLPDANNAYDLGSTGARFKDLWLAGDATIDGTINGASINGATISGGTLSGGNISGGTLTSSAVNSLGVTSTAITATGALAVASGASSALTLQAGAGGSLILKTPTFNNANGATYSFNAADSSGITATVCTTQGNCVGSGGGVVSTGHSNYIALFGVDGYHLGDSLLSQDVGATTVSINGNFTASGTINNATISGGNISGGTFNGANITGGALSASAVNSLGVTATNITASGALTVASGASSALTLQAGAGGSLILKTPTFNNANGATYSFNAADSSGVTATVCTTQGNCTGVGGGVTTSGGTTNRLAKFVDGQVIGNSIISDDSTTVTIAGNAAVQGSSGLSLGTASVAGLLALNDGAGNTTTLQSGSLGGSNLTLTLPSDDGSSDQCIKTDGTGVLSFGDCLSGSPGSGVNKITGATAGSAATGDLTFNNATTTSSSVTIDNATTTTKGIASFNTSDFSVSSGAVSLGTVGVDKGGTGATDVATARSNLQVAQSGTNADITSLTALTSITPSAALTIGATGYQLTLQGNASTTLKATNSGNTTTIGFATPTANVTYNFATAAAGTYSICTTQGNCTGIGGAVTTSGGTTNRLAKFVDGQVIGNSIISDDSTTVTIAGNAAVQGSSGLSLGTASVAGLLALNDGAGNTTTLQSGSLGGSNLTLTLPSDDGSSDQCIKTDGTGVLSFGDCLSGSPGSGVNKITGATAGSAATGDLTFNNATTTSSSVTIDNATTTTKGIASFNTSDFSVSSGAVSLGTVGVDKGGTGATDVATARSNLQVAQSGTNADITSLTALTSITPSAALTIGATGYQLTLQGNASTTLKATNSGNTTTIGFATPTANVTYNFATAAAGTYSICTTAGNCVGSGGGGVDSTGGAGYIALFGTDGYHLENSILSQSGSVLGVAGTDITATGALTISATGSSNNLTLQAGSGSGHVAVTGDLTTTGTINGATLSAGSFTGGSVASGSLTSTAVNSLGVTATNITASGALTVASGASSALTLQAGAGGSLILKTPTFNNANGATYSFNAADSSGVTATVCTTQGNCTGVGGGVTTSGGTTNRLAKFVDGQVIGNSIISDDSTTVTIAGNLATSGGGTINGATISGGTLSAGSFTGGSVASGSLTSTAVNSLGVTATNITASGALTVASGASSALTLQAGAGGSLILKTPTFNNANGATYSFNAADSSGITATVCTSAGNCPAVISLGTLDGNTRDAKGASVSGSTLYMQTADASNAGLVGTGSQAWAGAKTFSALITGNLGATIQGAATSINASSDFATNINTGSSNGQVTIGNTTAGAVLIQGTGGSAVSIQSATSATILIGTVNSGTITIGHASGTVTLQGTVNAASGLYTGGTSGTNLRVNSSGALSNISIPTNSSVTAGSANAFGILYVNSSNVLQFANINGSYGSSTKCLMSDGSTGLGFGTCPGGGGSGWDLTGTTAAGSILGTRTTNDSPSTLLISSSPNNNTPGGANTSYISFSGNDYGSPNKIIISGDANGVSRQGGGSYDASKDFFQIRNSAGNTAFAVQGSDGSLQVWAYLVSGSSVGVSSRVCSGLSVGGSGMGTLATCTSSGTDVAEAYGTNGSIPDGTIVMPDDSNPVQTVQDPTHPERTSTKAYAEIANDRNKAIGVVSTNPAMDILGESLYENEDFEPIGLSGRVPVRVNDENGPINPGDAIMLSSTPGVGTKADSAGKIIGYAVNGFSGSGEGKVVMFISNSYYAPSANAYLQNGDDASLANLNVSGIATINNLHVTGSATFDGDLTVATLKTVNIEISGHIITKGDVPTSQALTAAGTAAAVDIDGNDTAGTITITTGATGVTAGDLTKINFSKVFTKTPKIILSGQDDNSVNAKVYPKAKTLNDFMISTGQTLSANTTYTFDYFIVE